MNPVAEEIRSYCEDSDESTTLAHYGMPRRSGRYPWGSGKEAYQHSRDFLSRVEDMRKAGFTYTDEKGKTYKGDTAIAKSMGLSSTQFRAEVGIATDTRRMYQVSQAQALRAKGLGYTAIGREMGVNESTVRSLLDPQAEARMKSAYVAADLIKKRIEETGKFVDVGAGVERELNISSEKLEQAIYILKKEGYTEYGGRTPQPTNAGQWTTIRGVGAPGREHKELFDPNNVTSLKEYITRDGGKTFEKKFYYPTSIDSKRVKVLLADEIGPDGEPGIAKDGLIQLRRGVPDLSLGESRYSQVRILVDGDKYLKGMAVYSDNMPDGVDVIFNSNKKTVESAYKKIKDDPDNPFGSLIKDADQGGQYWYDPKTGQRVSASTPGAKLGAINKRSDEGDWSDWKDAVPSQFLSKQPVSLAKKQLKLAVDNKQSEFDEYCQLTNPTIKKYLLNKFADECDSAAVHLQAAALPGQKYHVMIPINSVKETEVYAPGYDNGTQLALVRYPHGGRFEIPILTVNNKHPQAKNLLGADSRDVVALNKKVADRLSGADFDGDTVMCIPTNGSNGIKIKNQNPLKGLEGFDPTDKYGPDTYAGKKVPLLSKGATQKQMGVISNLISDMTLMGAKEDELAAAVRHSMVIIDAEKHKLNYKQSEIDNNISALHKRYQGKESGGAATIISKAKGQYSVDKRQGSPKVNTKLLSNGKPNPDYDPSKPEGSLIWKTSDDLYYPSRKYDKATGTMTIKTTTPRKSVVYDMNNADDRDYYEPVKRVNDDGSVSFTNKDGSITYKTEKRLQKSTKMAETEDAYSLVSPGKYQMEIVYADYANSMKNMARQARMEAHTAGKIAYSAQAKRTYAEEVKSLENKVNDALKNAPRERLATLRTNAEIAAKKASNPDMEKKDIKKASQQALTKNRAEVGSVSRAKRNVDITDREWDAIQAGAISETKLKQILDNTDVDVLRQRATPRSYTTLNTAKINRIKAMSANGRSLSEIAKSLGVSTSTVSEYLKGVN